MRCIFDASRKVIKNFNSKINGPFWKVVKFAVGLCKSVLNQVLILWISEFDSYKSLFLAILYIKMDGCLFVPYTNPHFWTDRNQTLHTSPPWSGRDRRVCMDPQYFTFPTFSTYFVGSVCRFVRSRWMPAPHYPATALYPWCGVCWCDVTHDELCNENA